MLPVRPVDILSAVLLFSGVELRWAHRLKVYVPNAETALTREPIRWKAIAVSSVARPQ